MSIKYFLIGAAALSVSGCVETADLIEDPGAFDCRQRGASLMNVSYEQTSASPINFDAFGFRNYSVNAGGTVFNCSVDEDDIIVSFSRA